MQVDYHELDHLDLKSRTMREARELLDYRGKGTGRKFEGEDLEKILNAMREEQYRLLVERNRQPESDPWKRGGKEGEKKEK